MTWNQIYDPFNNALLSTAVAAIPVIVLLGAIAIFEVKAHWAAILGLLSALAVAIFGFGMPAKMAGLAAAYGASFSSLFARVAKAEKVALVPFFLKGIGDTDDPIANFQPDRIHPNEQSQARMLANVWPELKKLIK